MVTAMHNIHAELVQKRWPAEGIVYVRLYDDAGHEEWALLEQGCDYDKAFVILQTAALRLGGGSYGL
jgi:hypothetical protein